MEIRVQKITPENLPTVATWWTGRGDGEMPAGTLPPCGFVALDDSGAPAAAGWAYFPEGCKVAFLDWFVTRPGLLTREARLYLHRVLAMLEGTAAQRGRTILFGATPFRGMAREAQRAGYAIVDAATIHLAKRLPCSSPQFPQS